MFGKMFYWDVLFSEKNVNHPPHPNIFRKNFAFQKIVWGGLPEGKGAKFLSSPPN
jgi:hypothetical protein